MTTVFILFRRSSKNVDMAAINGSNICDLGRRGARMSTRTLPVMSAIAAVRLRSIFFVPSWPRTECKSSYFLSATSFLTIFIIRPVVTRGENHQYCVCIEQFDINRNIAMSCYHRTLVFEAINFANFITCHTDCPFMFNYEDIVSTVRRND